MARTIAAAVACALVGFSALAQDRTVRPVPAGEMKPGYGKVETIEEVRVVSGERSAAAGGSAASGTETPAKARPAYRVGVRLADGTLQYRDLDKPEFKVGDNVLLTNAGDVVPD